MVITKCEVFYGTLEQTLNEEKCVFPLNSTVDTHVYRTQFTRRNFPRNNVGQWRLWKVCCCQWDQNNHYRLLL